MPPKVENILSNPFYDYPFPRKISGTNYFFNVLTAPSVTFDPFIDQSQTLWRSLTLKTLIQQVALIVNLHQLSRMHIKKHREESIGISVAGGHD